MPYWDFKARGIMVGWTGTHGKAHTYRAILKGIAFEQRLMTDGAESGLENPVEHVIALGGSSSSLWCQIIADVVQRPVSVAQEIESICLGSGMLATAASGMHGNIREAADAMSGTGVRYEPDEGRAARYDKLYRVYKELYPSLRPLFPKLTYALRDESA